MSMKRKPKLDIVPFRVITRRPGDDVDDEPETNDAAEHARELAVVGHEGEDEVTADDAEELTPEAAEELTELTAFIDAHGGRLGPFRGWRKVVPPLDTTQS